MLMRKVSTASLLYRYAGSDSIILHFEVSACILVAVPGVGGGEVTTGTSGRLGLVRMEVGQVEGTLATCQSYPGREWGSALGW